MNNIARLQAEIAAQNAEINALREGYQSMIDYMHSSKFSENPYVHVTDVVRGLRQSASNATDASNAAWINEVGPKPEPSNNGYRCPECHELLVVDWFSTEHFVSERMRNHWIATHKENAG